MRIDLTCMPSPLLVVFALACSGLADPNDTASAPPGGGGSMAGGGSSGSGSSGSGPSSLPPPRPLPSPSCEVAGQTFPGGGNIPSGDSCNYCACYGGGVSCTSYVCPPVVCALAVEAADGVCSRFPLDPCKSQDPDCVEGAASCDAAGKSYPDGSAVPSADTCNSCVCDDGSVSCTEIACAPPTAGSCQAAGQSFPDGAEVPSGDSCNSCGCSDGNVTCTDVVCEPVICAAVVEVSDSVCSRFPQDPCISQDPDCGVGPGAGACEVAGQVFADGSEVPSGDSCNSCGCKAGGLVCTELACDLVFCAEFVEASDGVCSRFPLDPCSAQDPDCVVAPQPTEPVQPTETLQPTEALQPTETLPG